MSDIFMKDGVPTLNAKKIDDVKNYRLIDVRRPDEFTGELGHIPGAELVTLGPNLVQFLEEQDKDEKILFICRSGQRSANATLMALDMDYNDVANLEGGMILWNQLGLPKE
ncbi:MAG: rhodanese-like domain-containing protein [Bacteriovoracaceae bacterium]|nr:rhodanese-like domain-containing protein [Bacteriovoracaceae bacterium]